MDRLLPYLLIAILLIGGWNESFKSRFERLTGGFTGGSEQSTEATAAEQPTNAAAETPATAARTTPKPTPRYTPTPYPSAAPATQSGGAFFNDPNYRTGLDRSSTKKSH